MERYKSNTNTKPKPVQGERIQKKEATKGRSIARAFIRYTWWILVLAISFMLRKLVFQSPAIAETYAARVRPILMWPLTAITNWIPISFSFIALILAILFLLIVLIRIIRVYKVSKAKRLRYVFEHIRVLALVLSFVFLSYILFHGMNFARVQLSTQLEYEIRPHLTSELYEAAMWLRDEAANAREGLNEDQDGRYTWPEGEDTKSMLARAYLGYEAMPKSMQHFAGQYVRPKIVPLSYYWSYTGTAGMFVPFFGEANVNTDIQADEILSVALHEIAHTKGIAREDEANFMAFYTGILHPEKDFQYAAYFSAMIHASNELYRNDKDLWEALWADMPDGIRRDIAGRNAYWKNFEGKTKERAQSVNNTFLKANGEEDGIKSYGRMVDLVLAYYEFEVLHAKHLLD